MRRVELLTRPRPRPGSSLASSVRRHAVSGVLAGALCVAPVLAAAPLSWQAQTPSGRWSVDVRPQAPIKIGAYHAWMLRVSNQRGQPADVTVKVRGGMPSHGHGLPSTPDVQRVAAGEFLVEGMQFNMPGEWILHFDLAATGGVVPETATVRFALEP